MGTREIMQRRRWGTYAAVASGVACVALMSNTSFLSKHVSAAASHAQSFVSWSAYGGSNSDDQYSPLKQINRTNAAKLQQVWFYPSGNNGFRYGTNPLV